MTVCATCGRKLCDHTDAEWQSEAKVRAVHDAIAAALRDGVIRWIAEDAASIVKGSYDEAFRQVADAAA